MLPETTNPDLLEPIDEEVVEDQAILQDETEPVEVAESEEPVTEAKPAEGKKYVPLAALHEARQAKKALQARYDQLANLIQPLLERLDKKDKESPKAEEPLPDPASDPVQYIMKWTEAHDKRYNELKSLLEGTSKKTDAQERTNALREAFVRDGEAFKKAAPDYETALDFLRNSRISELKAAGYSEQDITSSLSYDFTNITQKALTEGRSPSETFYSMAKARGYQAKSQAKPNGKSPASLDLPSGSLRQAGKLTAEQLAELPEEEFGRLVTKHGGLDKLLASLN